MTALWTPPRVDRHLAGRTTEYVASIDRMADRLRSVIDEFNRDLKKIDPDLELVFFPPGVEGLVDVIPGRYHVIRKIPLAPPTIIPVVGPNGEFVEPDSGLFDYLRRIDLWNGRAKHDRERAMVEAERAAERRREREREERLEEIRERWAAATQTRISMSTHSPWSQNASATGRRSANEERKRRSR